MFQNVVEIAGVTANVAKAMSAAPKETKRRGREDEGDRSKRKRHREERQAERQAVQARPSRRNVLLGCTECAVRALSEKVRGGCVHSP